MTISDEERENIRDLFAGLGPVEIRRMFGGAGVYLGDACFALMADGRIWMRGDDELGRAFEAAGGERWNYQGRRKKPVAMPYWQLPDSALDDPDEAVAWARRSLVPAEAAAARKRAEKARRTDARRRDADRS